jgi:hypothetical protein
MGVYSGKRMDLQNLNEENSKIDDGYILIARKTLESDFFQKKPLLWVKLWLWLLLKANFKDHKKLKIWRDNAPGLYQTMEKALGQKLSS